MQDNDILGNIHALVEEEHRLRDGEAVDPARLREVEEQLDQCWDLLRQRRTPRCWCICLPTLQRMCLS